MENIKTIDLLGVNLVYSESGVAGSTPVILMHGWGCDHSTVASIARILEKDYHVFNIDLPGHGKSSEPPLLPDNKPWGVEMFTQLIELFAKELKLDNPVLIGHSFGGRVAILYGSRNDTRKIILVDAAGIKPKRKLGYYYKVYRFKLFKRLALLLLGKERGNKLIEKRRSKAGSSDYRNSSPVMRAVMSRCVNEDLKKVMPAIKAPTLLVWGEDDTATPLSDAKTMESLIPDAGLVSFRGCGHYSFLDNPPGFSAVLKSFLNIKP